MKYMKPGAIIELPDGRRGTIVYSWLDGFGFVWGERKVDPTDLPEPEAMLREEHLSLRLGCPCIGEDFTLIRDGSFEE